mgnify:CR=1 FL=1
MKKISTAEDIVRLDDMMYQLQQLNALVSIVQVAVAEAPGVNSSNEVSDALNYISINIDLNIN